MKILISGASGLVGREVMQALAAKGHQVLALARNSRQKTPCWDIKKQIINLGKDTDIEVVINLAGENIANGCWTAKKKERILRSRVEGTRLLADFFAHAEQKPKLLISASAVGIYGERG
ncbi:MAG: NAD-dependent epimerase/dehydratase family protein, partial [Candidatus Electrothrix sp. AR3]|nr:NAD-dependent epimerase/dehydratase family protein [Candidatus Electrothrix sp. AR3]